jgi:hypothetical protein
MGCSTPETLAQPLAAQKVALTQDTPVRTLKPVPALGLVTIDQLVPFHVSIRVRKTLPLSHWPTAVQLLGLTHETPLSWFNSPLASGLVTIVQLVPFHVSMSVWVPPPLPA